jgi:hypothetical protein
MRNLVHEGNEEREGVQIAVDGYPMAIVLGWGTVIAKFG